MESLLDKRVNISSVSTSTADFKKRVSVRNMSGYLRWSKGGNRINLELYQDNLPNKANATSKLYHIDLKDYQGRLHLIIPKRNPTFAESGNRRTY